MPSEEGSGQIHRLIPGWPSRGEELPECGDRVTALLSKRWRGTVVGAHSPLGDHRGQAALRVKEEAVPGQRHQIVAVLGPENLFEGFDASRYEGQARERWPQEYERSRQFTDTLTDQDQERLQRETTAQMVRMAEFMAAGTPVFDPAVQTQTDTHYQGICRFWTPDAAAYKTLGQTYVDDPQFRSVYDKVAAGLAEYQRDAMTAYADARLS